MKYVLLVDDDPMMHTTVKLALKSEFGVLGCFNLTEAQTLLSTRDDIVLVLLDRMLPDGDGLQLCQKIREDGDLAPIPIIFLSSLINESDRVSGFYAGADDYITKPFSALELRARVQARLRTQMQNLIAGKLVIDVSAHRVFLKDDQHATLLDLTRTEFKLLTFLIQSLGQVLSRELLLSKAWGDSMNVSDRVVDTHISHLRKKIKGSGLSLQSLRGEGYRLDYESSGSGLSASQ